VELTPDLVTRVGLLRNPRRFAHERLDDRETAGLLDNDLHRRVLVIGDDREAPCVRAHRFVFAERKVDCAEAVLAAAFTHERELVALESGPDLGDPIVYLSQEPTPSRLEILPARRHGVRRSWRP
jgi:hypothetical protein